MITAPRCLALVAYRARNDEGTGLAARCWRPAGHASARHASRIAYLRAAARKRELDRAQRGQRDRDLVPCGTEGAYRRHLRAREVPCEACREAASRISRERRAA